MDLHSTGYQREPTVKGGKSVGGRGGAGGNRDRLKGEILFSGGDGTRRIIREKREKEEKRRGGDTPGICLRGGQLGWIGPTQRDKKETVVEIQKKKGGYPLGKKKRS